MKEALYPVVGAIYNKELSAAEIAQNTQYFKMRFNL